MTDFIPEPRDRLDQPICSAIEAKNLKQALKLVEKRLTKSSDGHLLALKCFIQASHPLISERTKAVAQILHLASGSGKDAPREVPELELYDEACKVLFADRTSQESLAIGKIRVEAVKANPKDENLARMCFRSCLKRDDIEHAQQIANSLEKNFPSNHSYPFWAITMTSILASSPNTQKDRARLYSELAYKQIQKLADITSSTADGAKLPVRCIESPQELRLFIKMLSNTGRTGALHQLFQSPSLGTSSKVAKGEWVFQREYIMLLETLQEWNELFTLCDSLLTGSRAKNDTNEISDARGADWLVWKSYIKAAVELNNTESLNMVLRQLKAHQETSARLDKTYRRNAFLAMVEFAFVSRDASSSKEIFYDVVTTGEQDITRISACVFHLYCYLCRYAQTSSAFIDVKLYIESLNSQEQAKLLYMLGLSSQQNASLKISCTQPNNSFASIVEPFSSSESDKITVSVTLSKIQYLVFCSIQELRRQHSSFDQVLAKFFQCDWCSGRCGVFCYTCLEEQASKGLKNYGMSIRNQGISDALLPTDKHPADEWSIIAAMCLVKLGTSDSWQNEKVGYSSSIAHVHFILQAAAILEFAHTKSKGNPQILLTLIRLYQMLGAGSLAMRAYSRLALKQIQNDTLGYTIFDRISLFHPHAVADAPDGVSGAFDPTAQLAKLQSLYRGFGSSISTNCWRSFDNGSYDSIFQLIDVADRLARSIGRGVAVIELRKVKRLINQANACTMDNYGYDLLGDDPIARNYSDNLDYSSFPNYESSRNKPFETYTCLGPGPSNHRLQWQLFIDELWTLATSTFENEATKSAALKHFQNSRNIVLNAKVDDTQFTEFEKLLREIATALGTMINSACTVDENHSHAEFSSAGSRSVITNLRDYARKVDEIDPTDPGFIPLFTTTLETLYAAYESASLAIAVANFLSKEFFSKNDMGRHTCANLLESVTELRRFTCLKAEIVRKEVNERSWLDFVLDKVQSPRAGDIKSKDIPHLGDTVSEVVGQDFLETWAGEIVDSWRDSVAGLAFLKDS